MLAGEQFSGKPEFVEVWHKGTWAWSGGRTADGYQLSVVIVGQNTARPNVQVGMVLLPSELAARGSGAIRHLHLIALGYGNVS
jgi:hypothetical protein